MRIGDKVRLLRGTEEGKIIDIKNNKIVDVEIEDGFVIPALINEVVVIDKGEADTFGSREEEIETPEKVEEVEDFISEGIYIGFYEKSVDEFESYIINHTKNVALFSVSQFDKKALRGTAYGICEKLENKLIGNFTSSIFNESKKIYVEIIVHENETRLKKQPLTVELSLNRDLLKEGVYLNSISKEIALINLDEGPKLNIDVNELKNRMMESNPSPAIKKEKTRKHQGQTIDLHIDELSSGLNRNEILEHQLNEFEKAYDNALVMNMERLKVIHGIGAGILRNEIHKRLSKKAEVRFFEDADKERFGFGSTIIYF